MWKEIKQYFKERRKNAKRMAYIKSTSFPFPAYFNGVDLSKQVEPQVVDSMVKRLIEIYFDNPEIVCKRFLEIVRIKNADKQRQALNELDRQYIKGRKSFNFNAVMQVNHVDDLIYSLIKHKDICFWVEEMCGTCGHRYVRCQFDTPAYTWQALYGRSWTMHICPECLSMKKVDGMEIMN